MGRVVAHLIRAMMALTVIGWIIGLAISDRTLVTQWLAWIPSIIAVCASFVGLAVSFAVIRRPWVWIATTILLIGFSAFFDHRFLARVNPIDPSGSVRVLHWNLRWIGEPAAEAHWDAINNAIAPITILSNPGRLLLRNRGLRWSESGWTVLRIGDFAVLTTLEVIEARSLTGEGGPFELGLLRVRTNASALSILMIDLPSALQTSRWETAENIKSVLARYPDLEVDLIIGDFNTTPNSASLRLAFPGFTDAFADAGHGWSGSFPRSAPLWRIDQALVRHSADIIDYRMVDLKLGGHLAQEIVLAPRPAAPKPDRPTQD